MKAVSSLKMIRRTCYQRFGASRPKISSWRYPSAISWPTITTTATATWQSSFSTTTTTTQQEEKPNLQSLFKNPIVHQLWTARQEAKKIHQTNMPVEENLQGKPPLASRVEVAYPFAKDELLMETYRNPWGQARMGKMFEDLDALAGNIAFFHVNDPSPVIVTASVDRIRLARRPHVEQNQYLSGQVTWTGSSSMEIRMEYRSEDNSETPWLEAFVTFVVLDRKTHKPTKVPQILPQTDVEKRYFEEGAKRAATKKKLRKAAKTPSDELETKARDLLQKASPLLTMPTLADPYAILMSQTRMQTAEIAQPQVQNLHNRIFGGFLMRKAFELAFSTAYMFGGARPVFLEVDDVSFLAPVDVGDLLVFNSRVLYTDTGSVADYLNHMTTHCVIEMHGYQESNDDARHVRDDDTLPLVHVEVETWVTEPEKATSRLSNQFYFTFAIVRKSPLRHVLPGTHDEARRMVQRMQLDAEQAANDDYEI